MEKITDLSQFAIRHLCGNDSVKYPYNYVLIKGIFDTKKGVYIHHHKLKFKIYRSDDFYYIARNNFDYYLKIPIYNDERDLQIIELVKKHFKKRVFGKKYVKYIPKYKDR
jgi:hypothetical protein